MKKMKFKICTKCTIVLITILISIPTVTHAFILSGFRYLSQDAIGRVETLNKISDQDLKVDVALQVIVNPPFPNKNFTLTFSPGEFLYVPPSTDLEISICEGTTGGTSYDYIRVDCISEAEYSINTERNQRLYIPRNGQRQYRFYDSYDITISVPENLSHWKSYVIKANYTLADHVFKQGDYYVLWLKFSGLEEKENMMHYVVFPSSKSVPYRFPEDTEFYRAYFNMRGELEEDRWVFGFRGGKERFVWYFDADELESKNWYYMFLGVGFGLIGGLILLFGEIIWSRREMNKLKETLLDEIRPRCACGCGERVKKPGNSYIQGHNLKRRNRMGK